jgi:hypothetical protein
MKETDLDPPVKRFLEAQGYVVKGEIGACDVLAVRAGEPPLCVELKTTFSLSLVLQGIDRQALTDAVYLAVPPPRRRQRADIVKLCRRLGLGVLFVAGNVVEAVADPLPYAPRKTPRRTAMLLKEFHQRVGDTAAGGSAVRGGRMTAYRQDALRCLAALGREGRASPAAVKAATAVVRAPAILLRDVYGWFMRAERGVYGVSPKGEAALAAFAAQIAALETSQAALRAAPITGSSSPLA